MTEYRRITPEEAVYLDGVQAFQAGEWHDVRRTQVIDNTASIQFEGGGTMTSPAHFFTLRAPVPPRV